VSATGRRGLVAGDWKGEVVGVFIPEFPPYQFPVLMSSSTKESCQTALFVLFLSSGNGIFIFRLMGSNVSSLLLNQDTTLSLPNFYKPCPCPVNKFLYYLLLTHMEYAIPFQTHV
jgi:hypothetical protein